MDRSPLHIAAERGHTSVVEILIDRFRASVAARTKVILRTIFRHREKLDFEMLLNSGRQHSAAYIVPMWTSRHGSHVYEEGSPRANAQQGTFREP